MQPPLQSRVKILDLVPILRTYRRIFLLSITVLLTPLLTYLLVAHPVFWAKHEFIVTSGSHKQWLLEKCIFPGGAPTIFTNVNFNYTIVADDILRLYSIKGSVSDTVTNLSSAISNYLSACGYSQTEQFATNQHFLAKYGNHVTGWRCIVAIADKEDKRHLLIEYSHKH
jgi:hypothetical protein